MRREAGTKPISGGHRPSGGVGRELGRKRRGFESFFRTIDLAAHSGGILEPGRFFASDITHNVYFS